MNQSTVQATAVAQPTRPPSDGAKVVGILGGAIAGGLVAGPVGAIGGAVVGHVLTSGQRGSIASRQIEPPLNVASVDIPPGGIIEVNGVTYFTVQVVPNGGGSPWSISRRYQHFDVLRNDLHRIGPRSVVMQCPFPCKYWTRTWGNRLEQRRRDLEVWLKTILIQSQGRDAWIRLLRPWLESNRYQTHTISPPTPLTIPQAAPDMAPAFPLASAANAPQLPPSLPTALVAPPSTGANALLVQLPANATPGQLISFKVPGGRHVTLTVPQGATGGSVLHMSYDAMGDSISPLHVPSSPSQATQTSQASEPQVLQVQIPDGIHSGQLLGVTVPGGQQLNITVPEGALGGSELTLWFDPAANTLTPLP